MSGTFEQRSIYSGPIRRALEELQRRIAEAGGGVGTQGPTGPPGVVQAVLAGTNVTVDSTNPAYPIVASTATGGGTGTDEVWIGLSDPIGFSPTIELWFDPDAVSPSPGPTGAFSYVHNQGAVASTWVVDHNLGWFPNVTVEDSGGSTVEGEVVFNTLDRLTLTFSGAFSGVAYLS
jgi:hypothetical protein